MSALDGPRAKVRRAKHHIAEAKAVLEAFEALDPYEAVEHADPEREGQQGWVARVSADPPPQLALISGDAIHNLRSALDLLVRQLVEANGVNPGREAMPIGSSKTDFATGRLGIKSLKGKVSADAIQAIEALKPYKGGNDSLWALHCLDVIDKHRLLLVAAGAFVLAEVVFTTEVPGFERLSASAPINQGRKICPLKDGDPLLQSRLLVSVGFGGLSEAEVKRDHKFTFAVALHEPGIVEAEPLLAYLDHLLQSVEGSVEGFAPLLGG